MCPRSHRSRHADHCVSRNAWMVMLQMLNAPIKIDSTCLFGGLVDEKDCPLELIGGTIRTDCTEVSHPNAALMLTSLVSKKQ